MQGVATAKPARSAQPVEVAQPAKSAELAKLAQLAEPADLIQSIHPRPGQPSGSGLSACLPTGARQFAL